MSVFRRCSSATELGQFIRCLKQDHNRNNISGPFYMNQTTHQWKCSSQHRLLGTNLRPALDLWSYINTLKELFYSYTQNWVHGSSNKPSSSGHGIVLGESFTQTVGASEELIDIHHSAVCLTTLDLKKSETGKRSILRKKIVTVHCGLTILPSLCEYSLLCDGFCRRCSAMCPLPSQRIDLTDRSSCYR